MHASSSRRNLSAKPSSYERAGAVRPLRWPANWAFGAINSISGSGSSRLVEPGRFLDRGRGRSEPLRWPG